jgi:hypothetical protein
MQAKVSLRLCRLAVREAYGFPLAATLIPAGIASTKIGNSGRKGKAFPHSQAAEPLMSSSPYDRV